MPTYAGMTAEDADDSLFRLFRRHLVRCRYAKDRVEDAIKVVVKARGVSAAHKVAAE